MRLPGRIEPGSCAGALTGQPSCLRPARMVATSEMLSAMVRDFGCVAIWSRMAESGGDDVLRRDRDIESVGGAVMRAARVGSGFAAESGIVPSARPVESRVESRRVEP